MARAKRHFIPGYTWHITHRCHKKEFLFLFDKDKKRYIEWLFQAKKKYNIQILNFIVTSNHVHLLISDNAKNRKTIPNSVKLVAGRTAQEYNQRKNRKGAFWEDRYHSTAIENDAHLIKCMNYIDFNMVRAGVVNSPFDYEYCGLHEILEPKKRYGIIDHQCLMELLHFEDFVDFKEKYIGFLENYLSENKNYRENKWSQSIAVGSHGFIKNIKEKLGVKAIGRKIINGTETFELRENIASYGNIKDEETNELEYKNPFKACDKADL